MKKNPSIFLICFIFSFNLYCQSGYIIQLLHEQDNSKEQIPFVLHYYSEEDDQAKDIKSDKNGILEINQSDFEKLKNKNFKVFFQNNNDKIYFEEALITCPFRDSLTTNECAFLNDPGFTLEEICLTEKNTYYAWRDLHGYDSLLYSSKCNSQSNKNSNEDSKRKKKD